MRGTHGNIRIRRSQLGVRRFISALDRGGAAFILSARRRSVSVKATPSSTGLMASSVRVTSFRSSMSSRAMLCILQLIGCSSVIRSDVAHWRARLDREFTKIEEDEIHVIATNQLASSPLSMAVEPLFQWAASRMAPMQ